MDEFSYLSVLLSIIVGLAVAEILQGFRLLLLKRSHVRTYWPIPVWGFVLLVIAAQMWWSSFGLRGLHRWSFAMFGMVLVQTILLYMQAGVLFPEFPESGVIDLHAHYFAQRRWFFSILGSILVVSICKELVLAGSLPSPPNLLFHAVFFALAAAGVIMASERLHKLLALISVAAFASYIVLFFSYLR